MGKCWTASQGPSLHCPFCSLTFWSWHGASESLCPSAALPVAVPKTDSTFQLHIPALDEWMLFSLQLICQHSKNVAEQKLSENISQRWLQEFLISKYCFVLVFFQGLTWTLSCPEYLFCTRSDVTNCFYLSKLAFAFNTYWWLNSSFA